MSTTPTSNDFSDFQQYFIKCTIPIALSRIKDGAGDTRNTVKMFLIKMLKFNENTNNEVHPGKPVSDLVLRLFLRFSINQSCRGISNSFAR